ncbi:MAG: response regulator [Gemmatimonadota bacterium]
MTPSPAWSPDVSSRPSRVLIVDDERHNRQLLEVMLRPEGFFIEVATSGEEALAMVAHEPPDLILLDIMMPGMDGYQVATAIKSNPITRNIPVIIVTALDDRDSRMRGLSAGAEDFLTKPVNRSELCVRVRNLLRLKAYGDYHDKYSQILEGEVDLRTADLVESERLYRSTFDAAPVGVVHMGLDGRWLRVNQRVCDLLGYTRDELENSRISELADEQYVAIEANLIARMMSGGADHHVVDEMRFRRRNGGFVWARVNVSVHRDAEGTPRHFISVIEDITERRVLEEQVRQAGKMDAIGQLAAGVAHDFNNLLTVILGFTELVSGDANTVERHGKELHEIIRAARSAAGLTKQLLAFSRQQVLTTRPIDVNGLITDMTGMLARLIGEHVDISLRLTPDIDFALADRGQLEQVVMNLVVNARDAMPSGGHVFIETRNIELENSAFHDEAIVPGAYVMLGITDSGTGMTKETQRRLFEPFFTTKETGKGTGLGLSTTYGIVKQSKGYVWVYSELNVGTTFKVYLPRSSTRVFATPVIPTDMILATTVSETVLLVEDEPALLKLATRILENAGYHVFSARNGNDAEKMYHQHADAIQLLVTDVMMPACGGPELFARLRAAVPELPVLFMSGYSEQSARHPTGAEELASFIQKPFTGAELAREVRRSLDRNGRRHAKPASADATASTRLDTILP